MGGYELVETPSAHGEFWYTAYCNWCDWHTDGYEAYVEEDWYTHATENHPRRYARW